jgi:cell division protein FtsB
VPRLPRVPLTTLLLGAFALVAAYLIFTTARDVVRNVQLRDEQAALRREIAGLDEENRQLTAVRDYLKSDEYVEYVARSVLGLVRPGETLVVVSGTGAAPQPTPAPSTRSDREWWKELFILPTPTPAAP